MVTSRTEPVRGESAAPELSVIIPAYNSGAVLESTVKQFAEYFSGRQVEIIVVENGSTDNTADVCGALSKAWAWPGVTFHPMSSDKGMGAALRAGTLASRGQRVLLTADDLPFGFGDIEGADRVMAELGSIPPAVIGSKAHAQSEVERGLLRVVMTGGFATLRRVVLGTRTGDPQGTFIVDGTLLRRIASGLSEQGFLFTTELDYALELAGIRPVEVPIRLSDDHLAHASRISPKDVLQMAKGLVSLRRRKAELRDAATRAASAG
ncbi:glycosyltransferase [Rhodococcus sp. IEGM 1379]|uniref:glycosyltransferase n=1 Tax=Rhodococcus sp. IEGM 1379 TaxID=3047086 RepID=UPI0024B77037|nr:glycosyltransferase [Rhodococcus sp. IEGM 1379]MDI9916210.1 glycosyltransferase [Rhodococcus sp. IEGM 1379]